MKANGNDNFEQSGLATSEQLEQPQTMPLGVGNFEEQMSNDPLAGDGSSSKRIDGGTLLIVVVIIVAAAGLFSMRTLAKVTVPIASATEFDATVRDFITMLGTEDGEAPNNLVTTANDSVLEIINEQYTDRQVPLSGVQRNPFIIWAPAVVVPDTPVDPRDHAYEQQRVERKAQIESAGRRFVLKSVLMGNTPLANLSDKIVRMGETILVQPEGVEFRVTAISPGVVTLVASDERLDLTVQLDVVLNRD